MEIRTEHCNKTLIILVAGCVDDPNEFEKGILDIIRNVHQNSDSSVIIDLSNIPGSLSSSCLRSLLTIAKELTIRDIQFALCASPQGKCILEISGFSEMLSVYGTCTEAIDAISRLPRTWRRCIGEYEYEYQTVKEKHLSFRRPTFKKEKFTWSSWLGAVGILYAERSVSSTEPLSLYSILVSATVAKIGADFLTAFIRSIGSSISREEREVVRRYVLPPNNPLGKKSFDPVAASFW